jgi:hypothetical protein
MPFQIFRSRPIKEFCPSPTLFETRYEAEAYVRAHYSGNDKCVVRGWCEHGCLDPEKCFRCIVNEQATRGEAAGHDGLEHAP